MIKSKTIVIGVLAALVMASCVRNPKNPGREYIPDMGRDVAYEGYYKNPGEEILPLGMNAQLPPKGSIAQSFDVYPFSNTQAGYKAAGKEFTNEFIFTPEETAGEGKRLFDIYCAICHGVDGDGKGHLVKIDKYPQPPSYFRQDIMDLPDGNRYHTVMYGKGMMGSYATQMNHRERWLVLNYVQSLQDRHVEEAAAEAAATESDDQG